MCYKGSRIQATELQILDQLKEGSQWLQHLITQESFKTKKMTFLKCERI